MVRSIDISLSRMTPCGLVNMYQLFKGVFGPEDVVSRSPKILLHLRKYKMPDPRRPCCSINGL